MPSFNISGISIEGIACAVPTKKVDTVSFSEKFGKDSVDSFIKMTGIKSTYCANELQTASDLCFIAAKKILEERNINPNSIGVLIFISQTPDYRIPSTACVLHKRLEISQDCAAFDINLGCSGYIYGLQVCCSLLQNSDAEYALVLVGDTCRRTGSPDDHSSAMMFGDAGAATLLKKDVNAKPIIVNLKSDGNGFKAIITPSGAYRNTDGSHERLLWSDGVIRSDFDGYMNGVDVFNFSILDVPQTINRFMNEQGTTVSSYDSIMLHQANALILKQVTKKIKAPPEKVPISFTDYGNTSSVSIPLTIVSFYGEASAQDVFVLMSGFGVGLSWGVASAHIDTTKVFPMIYSDEYFVDGGINHD
jgi:3-oxoacyl-[acyl-carrier-protein] synthase-3